MRIETMTAGVAVHVSLSDKSVELAIGEAGKAGTSVAKLSVPQAEMVMHALGLEVAQAREQERRSAEERQHTAEVIEQTEVRRR